MEEDRHQFDVNMIKEGQEWESEDYDDYEDDEDYHDDNDDDFDHTFDHSDLNADEKNKRFNNIIRKMDLNNDLSIDREELAKWILMALQNMDARNMHEDFDTADQDGDDQIGFVEYVHGIYGVAHNKVMDFTYNDCERNPELADFNRVFHREHSRFLTSDKNNDGKLNKEEYKQFYNPGHQHGDTEKAISLAMKFVDTNNDGELSFQEFIEEGKVKHANLQDKDRDGYQEVFDQMDLDDSDKLNGIELFLWINQDNGEIAADETDHLIMECDKDHDDVLSYKEIVDKMDDFLDSDATEYGSLLQHDEL